MGTALGGYLALVYAQQRPHNVRSVVLCNSFASTFLLHLLKIFTIFYILVSRSVFDEVLYRKFYSQLFVVTWMSFFIGVSLYLIPMRSFHISLLSNVIDLLLRLARSFLVSFTPSCLCSVLVASMNPFLTLIRLDSDSPSMHFLF